MKNKNFISHSKSIESILNGLTLCKSLMVSSLIVGEPHTGKITLVKSLFPKTPLVDANNYDELVALLEESSELIIYNFEAIKNVSSLKMENRRIIAIANYSVVPKSIEEYFAFIYTVPPLKERLEDVEYFTNLFIGDLKKELLIEEDIPIDIKEIDLSQNFMSMKRYIYKELIKKTLSSEDIENILYDYLYGKLGGKNSYKELLPTFERPLIEAGLNRYKSQLQLAEVLGLNRNTLRKKINENNIN